MNNRWRRIARLDYLGYACCVSKTDNSTKLFNSIIWGVVALGNHTEHRTPSFRKGKKHYAINRIYKKD